MSGSLWTETAAGETASPSAAARIAHAEFLPYMDPPPGEPATVCLVDTGVDLNPDTQSNIVSRVALDGGDGGDVWDRKHGTEMAMMMGAPINGWGTVGAWPLVRIASVRAMSPGTTGFPFNAYSRAIEACMNISGVRVISLSFSGARPSDAEIRRLEDYAVQARANGLSVVAGAGNGGGPVEWPAAAPAVFAVAAIGEDATPCDFSARGPELGISAPGCGLELADPATGEPISYAGTSPAAAFTAAILAALRSYRPGLTAAEAEGLLRDAPALDVDAAFRAVGLGVAVDTAQQRIPSADARATTTPIFTHDRDVPDSASVAWPTLGALNVRPQWPPVRIKARWCARHTMLVELSNRPPGARVVIRRYRRTGEFRSRIVGANITRRTRIYLRRDFDFLTVQFAGTGRANSRLTTVETCRAVR
jgi:hypothetical protein